MAEDILTEDALPATTPSYQRQGTRQFLRCFELELEPYNRDSQPVAYSYVIFDQVKSFLSGVFRCFGDDSKESFLMHSLVTYNFISHTIVLKMINRRRQDGGGPVVF
jgi:hypothetical protein